MSLSDDVGKKILVAMGLSLAIPALVAIALAAAMTVSSCNERHIVDRLTEPTIRAENPYQALPPETRVAPPPSSAPRREKLSTAPSAPWLASQMKGGELSWRKDEFKVKVGQLHLKVGR